MKQKKKDIRKFHKKAWILWSRYRRKSAANFQGLVRCYSCAILIPWQETDLGHYIHGKLDFDPINTNPQCTRCNRYLHGNLGAYGEHLIKDYGLKKIEVLRKRAGIPHKYTIEELEAIINKYKNYE